jgi:zinc protease
MTAQARTFWPSLLAAAPLMLFGSMTPVSGQSSASSISAPPASASASAARESEPIDLHIGYTQVVLRNGLTVLVHRDPTLPLMSVNLWYRVGSRDERPGRTGFAHLFEHLMFEGSRNVPSGAFDTLLEDAGAHSNGSTSADRTNYWIQGPANALELALWLEADRMATLLDAVDQETLEVQRAVVKNERRQAYENRPYGLAWETILSLLYPEGHPYSWPVIGSMEDLAAASMEDVQGFFRQWYAPNNAILSVAGDVQPQAVIALAERLFGGIPRGPAIERRPPSPPVRLEAERRMVLEDDVQLPRLYLAWHAPEAYSQGDATLQMAAWILAGGKSSRLHRLLVQELQVAQEVWAFQEGLGDTGVFEIVVTGLPGAPLEPLEALVREALQTLVNQGVTERERRGALHRIETDFAERVERVGGFGGKADLLNEYYMFQGDPGFLPRDMARFRRVTEDQVQASVRTFLHEAPGVVLHVVPRSQPLQPQSQPLAEPPSQEGGVATEGPDLSERPARALVTPPTPGPLPALTIPAPRRRELSNGIPVLFLERRGVPLITMQMVFPASPEAGLGGLATAVMEEGTGTRSRTEIAETIEYLGATMAVTSGWDGVVASLTAVRPRMGDALEVFADVIRNPAFPDAELNRVRTERKNRILQAEDDPRSVASNRFIELLFGSDHPYGAPLLGTAAVLDQVQRADLIEYHARVFNPRNATLVVSGEVSPDSVMTWLEKAFGDWSGGEDRAVPFPATPLERGGDDDVTIHLIHRPGAPQSELRVGRVGPARQTEDFLALELLNSALGGSFTSRLNQNLREDKGFTYGVGSAFQMRREAGPFVVATAVHTPTTADAVREILNELRAVRGDAPLTPEELARARNFASIQLIERFETSADLADRFSELALLGLPDEEWRRIAGGLRQVPAAAITEVAGRWLSGPLVVVVVGDRDEVEAPLRALGVGPVVVYDPDGVRP